METEELEFESTGKEVPRNLLSPKAREMFKDSKVIWMAKRKGKDRVNINGSSKLRQYWKVLFGSCWG